MARLAITDRRSEPSWRGGLSLGVLLAIVWIGPALAQAPKRRILEVTDVSGVHRFQVEIVADASTDDRALEYLARTLRVVKVDRASIGWRTPTPSAKNDIEISLTPIDAADAADFVALPPDGFSMSAPRRIRLERPLVEALSRRRAYRLPRAIAAPPQTAVLTRGGYTQLAGKLRCRALDGDATIYREVPFATVRVGGAEAKTDDAGAFTLNGRFPAGMTEVQVIFEGNVVNAGQSTPLKVMDELQSARSESAKRTARVEAGKLEIGTITLRSVDCEVFRLGAVVLTQYHQTVAASPPAGHLRIKRWSGVWDGTPYCYYDYIVLTTDWGRKAPYRGESTRERTMFHEFGHSVRHAADGDEAHWGWDNFRWAYARIHSGCEVFNTQFAFNEGWGGYWLRVGTGVDPQTCSDLTPAFLDWNENMVATRLADLNDSLPPATAGERARKMVRVLTSSPGRIHNIRDFEVRYCELYSSGNSNCTGPGVPARAQPASCPPGFNDDGATCRLVNIIAKPSYGRGVGTIPTVCTTNRPELDAGLCYPRCASGYSGVGPVCWQKCPSSFPDQGAFCGKPNPYGRGTGYAWEFGDPPFDLSRAKQRCVRDHGSCEQNGLIYYPKCKSGFHSVGCCICSPNCPTGMPDIGVSCAKKSYGRGVGTIPNSCAAGRQLDAGLCYPPCRAGDTGVGPLCWGHCPTGFMDHGATCYRDPNVLVK